MISKEAKCFQRDGEYLQLTGDWSFLPIDLWKGNSAEPGRQGNVQVALCNLYVKIERARHRPVNTVGWTELNTTERRKFGSLLLIRSS